MINPVEVLAWLSSMGLLTVVQLWVGKFLKNSPVPNKVIPWVTLLLAILGYSIAPIPAAAATVVATATHLPTVIGLSILAGIHTLLVTGAHSFSKNAILPALRDALSAIIGLTQARPKGGK